MAIGDKIHNVEINDSEFERIGWQNARYKGTKLTSAKLNKFTKGDITFGKKPVIEQYSKTVYVFNQADHSFESVSGIYYPTTDIHNQSLPDKRIVGATMFKIDRAVTFTIGTPSNFSQIEPGANKDDPSFFYFDTLVKNDLSLFNSCSVRFFDNANNGFVKPQYIVGYNKGEFDPAASYFLSASTDAHVSASGGNSSFKYAGVGTLSSSLLYINPNIESWFISKPNASGSQGTLGLGNTAIALDHIGGTDDINSIEGYYHNLSKLLSPNDDSYYINFNKGSGGSGSLNEKNILKAFDFHKLAYSSSGDNQNINPDDNTFNIQTTGRNNFPFIGNYIGKEYILFKEKKRNNVVHLDFNLATEAPAGIGNGGVIIPENLHPAIKESLNVYLGNAGLGAQGGATAQFGLGGAVQSVNTQNASQLATGAIGFQGSDIEEATSDIRQVYDTNLAIANQSAIDAAPNKSPGEAIITDG